MLRRLEVLRDPMLGRVPFGEMLDLLLDRLRALIGSDTATFMLVDPVTEQLVATASRGVPMEVIGGLRVPVGAGFSGRIAAMGQPVIVEDLAAADIVGTVYHDAGVRSLLGVPIIVENRVIGVAHVGSKVHRTYDDADIRLLQAAADRAAVAIDHGLLLDAERRARADAEDAVRRLQGLQAMSAHLVGALSLGAVVETVLEQGLQAIGALAGGVWVAEGDGSVRLRGYRGYPAEVVRDLGVVTSDDATPAAEAVRERQTVVLRSRQERAERYPRLADVQTVGDAFIAVPLVVDGSVLGLLTASFASAASLEGDGVQTFVEAAAAQCAAALHRALTVERERRAFALAENAVARLTTLQSITARLSEQREPDELAESVIREAVVGIGASPGVLMRLDGEVLRIVRSYGLTPEAEPTWRQVPLRPGLPVTDAVLRRAPVVLQSVAERDRRYPGVAGLGRQGEHALVCLPLQVGERVLGALTLSLPEGRATSAEEVAFLQAIGDQCAHALERSRLLGIERRGRERLELLADASRLFSASLDATAAAEEFGRIVVPRVADTATVYLLGPDGELHLAATANVDPEVAVAHRAATQSLPRELADELRRIAGQGEPQLATDIPVNWVAPDTGTAPLDELLRRQAPRSAAVLPLVAHGRVIGLLTLTTVSDRPQLSTDDVEVMAEVASRLALALDNARLFEQQTSIARTLQDSLLPAVLPAVPGARVAVRYLPGTEGTAVGGDFYDVIPLASGRIGLVVGDVMGRGVRAAAVMGQLRAAVRSYTLEGHGPASLLTRLDRLVEALEEGLIVTCVYGEWDPQRSTVVLSTAGHLPPLVRRPGETPRFLDVEPGAPLGVGTSQYREATVPLPTGSLLLMYTDGLVEGPHLPVEEGMRRLAAAVTSVSSPDATCDEVLRVLRPVGDGSAGAYDDDTAMLALLTTETADAPAHDPSAVAVELPADAYSPGRARLVVEQVLRRWGFGEVAGTAVLLVSELVTNAVRHAGTGLRLELARTSDRTVRLSVTDHAPQAELRVRSPSAEAEGGRGLLLVERLSARWGTHGDDAGKTVWFEVGEAEPPA